MDFPTDVVSADASSAAPATSPSTKRARLLMTQDLNERRTILENEDVYGPILADDLVHGKTLRLRGEEFKIARTQTDFYEGIKFVRLSADWHGRLKPTYEISVHFGKKCDSEEAVLTHNQNSDFWSQGQVIEDGTTVMHALLKVSESWFQNRPDLKTLHVVFPETDFFAKDFFMLGFYERPKDWGMQNFMEITPAIYQQFCLQRGRRTGIMANLPNNYDANDYKIMEDQVTTLHAMLTRLGFIFEKGVCVGGDVRNHVQLTFRR